MTASKNKLTKAEIEQKVACILKRARQKPRFQAARERDALISAIEYGDLDIAHSLLARGVDPNSTKPNGRSALWYAAHWPRRGGLIRDLIRRGARLPDDVLMGPVHDGDAPTVRLLIRHGANVNCVATFTRYLPKFPQKEVLLTVAISEISARKVWRAAHPASEVGTADLEAVPIMLIKAGANVNRLAFEYALFEGYIRTTLGLAAHCGLCRTVKAMLAAGADVNQQDTWGGTALFDAAHEGHVKVARVLLAAGARAHLKRRDGETPLSIARQRGFVELANEIEEWGSRVSR